MNINNTLEIGKNNLAKNTLILYSRLVLNMAVSLYSVRVVLNALGVVDYGIFNLIGGVVGLISFLSNSMAASSQRYLSFELGKSDISRMNILFSTIVLIYILIAIIVLLFTETIGLWFINNRLVFPYDKAESVNQIFHLSMLTFLCSILTIPYNAIIIANGNMKLYGAIGILEIFLKILGLLGLVFITYDKLRLYALITFINTFLISAVYFYLCRLKYSYCYFKFFLDKSLFKEIIVYTSWNFFGSISGVLSNQGINILLNLFYGPSVNSVRAISYQVSGVLNQFVGNFVIAFSPRITILYAANELNKMMDLIFSSSKFSFYILLILSTPILFETEFILYMWVKQLPDNLVIFTKLSIIVALIDSLSFSLMSAAQATGKIKLYQAIVGGILLLNLPMSYFFMKIGCKPHFTLIVSLGISILSLFFRVIMLKKLIRFPIIKYLRLLGKNIGLVATLSFVLPSLVVFFFQDGFFRFCLVIGVSLISTSFFIFLFGLSAIERASMVSLFRKIILKKVMSFKTNLLC